MVGEVLGKFHPHGDQAAYDAMVRMAQDFSLRYPLVDGSGNFGSLDGDPAAAMRYTEARLSQIAEELLVEIDKDTVGFRPNYDNSLKEPVVLPARFPQLLVNGTSGIAVGMSCSFPPHNLGEVIDGLAAMIDNSNIDVKDLLKYIKGPDFPTSGQILNSKKELREIYQTGSGGIRIRGEYTVEDLPRGRQAIVFTSIPYQVNKAKLLEKLIGLMEEKKLPQVSAVRDESTHEVRVVLELKAETNAELVTAYLFKHTDLESTFPMNFTALKPNMEPERLSLKEIMRYFLDFRHEITTKRLNYDLRLLKARLHILQAFEMLYDDLDTAIKIIRKAKSREDAAEKLKKHFKLDDEQVKAILDMQLYKLVGLEIERILKEKAEKTKLKKDIEAILASQKKIWGLIKTELLEIKEKYGDKRKSVMKAAEDVEFSQEDFIVHEDVTVILTKMGWIRRVKTVGENLRFKEGDELLSLLPANTRDNIAVFSSAGKVYVMKAFDLPTRLRVRRAGPAPVQVRRRRAADHGHEPDDGLCGHADRRSKGETGGACARPPRGDGADRLGQRHRLHIRPRAVQFRDHPGGKEVRRREGRRQHHGRGHPRSAERPVPHLRGQGRGGRGKGHPGAHRRGQGREAREREERRGRALPARAQRASR